MKKIMLSLLLFISAFAMSQNIRCRLVSAATTEPVSYANVGILNKETGTVSDQNGYFTLPVSGVPDDDCVRISVIGFESKEMSVAELRKFNNTDIVLQPKVYELAETLILPGTFKRKKLGVTSFSRKMLAGFSDHILGKEMGIVISNKKLARLQRIHLNIGSCDHDTIFYRINVYKITDRRKMILENVLTKPIYLNIAQSETRSTITLDVSSKNICIKGDFMVTVEYVKDLKKGNLYFSCGMGKSTYYRSTSQAKWKNIPVGIAINVEADVQE